MQQRAFENEIKPDQLHAFVLDRVSQVVERIAARLVVRHMPIYRNRGSFDAGSRRAVEACDCATFADGYTALIERGALDAKLGHRATPMLGPMPPTRVPSCRPWR